MKTAIIFTGFVRSFSIYKEQLYIKLLEAFPNADIYICTWDIIDIHNTQKIDLSTFREFKSCRGIKILDWEFYKNFIPKTIPNNRDDDVLKFNRFAISSGIKASNNIRNQWFLVSQAKDLIPKNYYDTIVRTRFDLNFTSFNVDDIKSGITIPYNFFSNHFAKDADLEAGFCDHVAYGDAESMMQYLGLYEYYDIMYHMQNLNICCAETVLKYYLTRYKKIKINMNNDILYQIVKSEVDVDNTALTKYPYNNI